MRTCRDTTMKRHKRYMAEEGTGKLSIILCRLGRGIFDVNICDVVSGAGLSHGFAHPGRRLEVRVLPTIVRPLEAHVYLLPSLRRKGTEIADGSITEAAAADLVCAAAQRSE